MKRFKPPEQLNISLKGARGLVYLENAYALRPELVEVVSQLVEESPSGVELKAGQETEVVVSVPLSMLPANANIKMVTATLKVSELPQKSTAGGEKTTVLPANANIKMATATLKVSELPQKSTAGGEKTTVGIAKGEETEETYNLRVEMPNLPRNVEIKLAQGEVFWTNGGTLSQDSYLLSNFAEQLNAYLDRVQPTSDSIPIQFLVKSDTPGKVEIILNENELDYSLLQTQIWDNSLDNSIRVDRNLQLDFATLERIPLQPISAQGNQKFSLDQISLNIGGELGQERLLGSVDVHNGREFATITNDYSLAQSFELEVPIKVTGITAYFKASSEAELYVEIQHNLNGFPSVEPPLTKSHLAIAPVEDPGSKRFTSASFETPVDLEAKKLYWVVIKGIRGQAQLGLQDQKGGYLRQFLINRGGRLWKNLSRQSNSAISALVRLIYLPEIDNQTAAIEIGIEDVQSLQQLDPEPEAQTLSIDVKNTGIQQAVIVIKSHARGSLSIANVIQEYKPV